MSDTHLVLGGSIRGPWPAGTEVIYFGMGCYWGADKKLWAVPGVVSTAVGFMGGTTPEPVTNLVASTRSTTALVTWSAPATTWFSSARVSWYLIECSCPSPLLTAASSQKARIS